jgi:hypothetical protein
MQFVGELEQPLMLCIDFWMSDAVFFFPVKNAHACRIGNICPQQDSPNLERGSII